jgi:hypothetical protein
MKKPHNEAVAAPNLYVVAVNEPLCLNESFAIVTADHLLKSFEVTVGADNVKPIFDHFSTRKNPRQTVRSGGDGGMKPWNSFMVVGDHLLAQRAREGFM